MPEWEENWPWHRIKTDPDTREEFLRQSYSFINHVAGQVCHRSLEWGRDEELSEALIAFNDAINAYEPARGVPFLAYARVLIKRRLIDFYRRQPQQDQPIDADGVQLAAYHISIQEYQAQEEKAERAAEIREYARALAGFDLTFQDLVEASPKHRDTRETLLRAARELAFDASLWGEVVKKGKIPMNALALKTGIHGKVLERGRKYILAVAYLVAHQNDFIYLREYVVPSERRAN